MRIGLPNCLCNIANANASATISRETPNFEPREPILLASTLKSHLRYNQEIIFRRVAAICRPAKGVYHTIVSTTHTLTIYYLLSTINNNHIYYQSLNFL